MDVREFRAAVRGRGAVSIARVIAAVPIVVITACASGGGATTTPAPTTVTTTSTTTTTGATATTSASAAVSPVADGDIEHTTFGPGLGIDLSKMLRRSSGLYVQDLEVGTGSVAAQSRTAVVRYAGYLPSGKSFDSGEITITIGAGKVIRAWDEGVLGMRVGGRRRLISPPHLAYGAKGAPPVIPPNAVLVFDMQLMQVY